MSAVRLASPRFSAPGGGVGAASRLVDRLPPVAWPLIAAAAGWPSLAWSLARFRDGSDDPFGIVAWGALAFAFVVARRRFARRPRPGMLAAAGFAAVVAAWPFAALPDLARALVSAVAIVLAFASIAERDEPLAPYAGLALLALPLLSSLQFYAGFPLRVVTAEASRWLLSASGHAVARDGSALVVDGRLVLVDAPCAGVAMAWVSYFIACCAAWLFRIADAAILRRLPLVGIVTLAGNVVRNTVLVAATARDAAPGAAAHAAIGLAVEAAVVVAVVALFGTCRERRPRRAPPNRTDGRFFAPPSASRSSLPIAVVFAFAALLPIARPQAEAAAVSVAAEWPSRYDGMPLVPVALSAVERRFADAFPGAIGRFASGSRIVVLRDVDRPTRRLHPAADCYRALGYAIDGERLEVDVEHRLWRCFAARGRGGALRVCERIVDADGDAFTDASSWYWSAVLGRSRGPWRATTVAERVGT